MLCAVQVLEDECACWDAAAAQNRLLLGWGLEEQQTGGFLEEPGSLCLCSALRLRVCWANERLSSVTGRQIKGHTPYPEGEPTQQF